MKSKNIVLAVFSLVIAYILFKMRWVFADLIEIALILMVAYVVYLLLKKIA